MNLSAHLSLTALIIFAVVSLLIPLLSSLLVKAHWPAEVAGLLTLVLATANGLLTQWADQGSAFNWHAALSAAFVSLIIAFQARARIWLGSKTDAKALAVGSS